MVLSRCVSTIALRLAVSQRQRTRNWQVAVSLLTRSTTVRCHTIELEAATLSVATEVTCLIVIFDNELTFAKHVTSVVLRCFCHLRQLRAVRKSLTKEAAKTVVHAFIASRIDYRNSVFYRISAVNLQALQSVLNAGAWLVMRKRKFGHITATLCNDLHWLFDSE